MGNVLKAAEGGYVELDLGSDQNEVWCTFDVIFTADALALWLPVQSGYFLYLQDVDFNGTDSFYIGTGSASGWIGGWMSDAAGTPTADTWHTIEVRHIAGGAAEYYVDSSLIGSGTDGAGTDTRHVLFGLYADPNSDPASVLYVDNVKIGTTRGASDLFSDDFESGNLSAWTSTSPEVSVIDNPFGPPPPPTYSLTYDGNGSDGGTVPVDGDSPYAAGSAVTVLGPGDITLAGYAFSRWSTSSDGSGDAYYRRDVFAMPAHDLTLYARWIEAGVPMGPGRRVGIAFDDTPLEPDPTWTWLDDASVFPAQFVAGYDTKNGRQTLVSQTETGTATVYINDRAGLLDDRNDDSPYQGKLSGRQIILQLWNPVDEVWEQQFQGLIDNYSYDIDGSAVDANGDPINASIQLECVDIFDYLNGYGLTPGIDGYYPTPEGGEDGVWYAQTTEKVQTRFIEILADANVDPSRYHLAQGNVNVIGVKYDPDESALTALRDAADAELPFIANIYVDRYGRFVFRGRYSRFDPDFVASEPGSDWDFQRWPLGDGKAIQADPSRGQVRILSYERSRADLINAALAYPQGIQATDMPDQVYAADASIALYGKHQAPPMSDLLTCEPTVSGYDKLTETFLFAKLLVENKKAPRIAPTALQLKAMRPDDPRAAATWGAICGADIDHIVNLAVGYPGGTGLTGGSPEDDYYIEGRSLTVRPLNGVHDYVECDLEVSPAIWSMDTHEVFPPIS